MRVLVVEDDTDIAALIQSAFRREGATCVMSRARLLDRVWGADGTIESRTVDVHLGRLRAKLGPAGGQIETVFGLGYRFVEDAHHDRVDS